MQRIEQIEMGLSRNVLGPVGSTTEHQYQCRTLQPLRDLALVKNKIKGSARYSKQPDLKISDGLAHPVINRNLFTFNPNEQFEEAAGTFREFKVRTDRRHLRSVNRAEVKGDQPTPLIS